MFRPQFPSDRHLIAAALLNYLGGAAPFLVLDFLGRHGSAISTSSDHVVMAVDPRLTLRTRPPKSEDDLWVTAAERYIVTLENVSHLTPDMSDALCSLTDGGGSEKRALYCDRDVVTVSARRPVIINGITDHITRPDLASRAISIPLLPISPRERLLDATIARRRGALLSELLHDLLDAMVIGLQRIGDIPEGGLPRRAAAAAWAMACSPFILGEGGDEEMLAAFIANGERQTRIVLESGPRRRGAPLDDRARGQIPPPRP